MASTSCGSTCITDSFNSRRPISSSLRLDVSIAVAPWMTSANQSEMASTSSAARLRYSPFMTGVWGRRRRSTAFKAPLTLPTAVSHSSKDCSAVPSGSCFCGAPCPASLHSSASTLALRSCMTSTAALTRPICRTRPCPSGILVSTPFAMDVIASPWMPKMLSAVYWPSPVSSGAILEMTFRPASSRAQADLTRDMVSRQRLMEASCRALEQSFPTQLWSSSVCARASWSSAGTPASTISTSLLRFASMFVPVFLNASPLSSSLARSSAVLHTSTILPPSDCSAFTRLSCMCTSSSPRANASSVMARTMVRPVASDIACAEAISGSSGKRMLAYIAVTPVNQPSRPFTKISAAERNTATMTVPALWSESFSCCCSRRASNAKAKPAEISIHAAKLSYPIKQRIAPTSAAAPVAIPR
mmetsp:Transcript_77840/g.228182  ORF Transcript_77840/g.228182 Transcript_77840/m.228182 type:complete len:416 (-) Transcript_77840:802-2049(-)